MDRDVNLSQFIQRASEELGTWVRADYGLEVMCRGEDMSGTFHLRAQGHILASVHLPENSLSPVPGAEGMEVWTHDFDLWGWVHLRGPDNAPWWDMRA